MVTVDGWKSLGPLKHSLLQSPELLRQSPNPPFLCKPVGKVLPPHFRVAEEVEELCLASFCYLKRSWSVPNPKAAAQMMTHGGVTVMPHNGVSCAGSVVLLSLLQ